MQLRRLIGVLSLALLLSQQLLTLPRNNREIRALFAYFGVERAEFLCSSDCVAERYEF
jgi:hypothetical protein